VADAKPLKQILASGISGIHIFTGTSSTEFCNLSSWDASLNWGADRHPIPLQCGHRTWMERLLACRPDIKKDTSRGSSYVRDEDSDPQECRQRFRSGTLRSPNPRPIIQRNHHALPPSLRTSSSLGRLSFFRFFKLLRWKTINSSDFVMGQPKMTIKVLWIPCDLT
jgi:hypothetical protein